MSGPKVVRIVTIEEVIAICRGHLARLDAALDEWKRVGRRNNTLSEADIARVEARCDRLRRLLEQGRFMDLQKAVPKQIADLAADQEARLASAAAAAAEERSSQRRTQAVASSVLGALDRAGILVAVDLRRHLEEAAAGQKDGAAAITRAFALLSTGASPALTEHQRQLAQALKERDDRLSFSQWLANQPTLEGDGMLSRIDRHIAQLAVTLGEPATLAFAERLRQVSSEPASRRSLLLDSLEVDLAQAVARARERTALQTRLRMLTAELDQFSMDAPQTLAKSIAGALDGPTEALVKLEADATLALTQVRGQLAAQARRKAVLQGLAGLGYQVTEGLETAWVKDGRVVLRKVSQPGYGVEVGGGLDSPRMQMRTVAFRANGAPADKARDMDAETIWCNELATLNTQLAAAGGNIVVEQALAVGATPVKVVSDTSSAAEQERAERPRGQSQRSSS
jgi:hypothetical protein